MTPQDLGTFAEWFSDLAATFKLYGSEDQKAATMSSYFQTLQRFPLDRVRRGYEKLKETSQKWPVPAAWIGAMPRQDGGDLPLMTPAQMRELDEAERLFYEGPFCHCAECETANATHLNLRYVPRLDRDGQVIPMQHAGKLKAALLGEWIHGHRLKTWYATRAKFYEKLESLKPEVKVELETPTPTGEPEGLAAAGMTKRAKSKFSRF